MKVTRRAWGTWMAAGSAWPALAQPAAMRALLVGVSEYPGLPKAYQLQGPRNDVQWMQALLRARGFAQADLTVLADGVPGAKALPTRAAILAGMQELARISGPGDFALLYFCGHGSQQPVTPGSPEAAEEPDGLHEIFLPRDVQSLKPPQGSAQVVDKAVANHEFRRLVDRIVEKGAFVWAIFDACHSATLVRGGPVDEVVYRQVPPEVLGLDSQALAQGRLPRPGPGPVVQSSASVGKALQSVGKAVYFYAAQTTEKAVELPLPPEVSERERQRFGAFSYALLQALASGAPMSYRQLAQHIQLKFATLNLQRDLVLSDRQHPAFGGSGLDEPVLMRAGGFSAPQWGIGPAAGGLLRVQGGALEGLAVGALLTIAPGPLAPKGQVLGYAWVTASSLVTAQAELVAHAGLPALAPSQVVPGCVARLVRPGAQYQLRVHLQWAPAQAAPAARGGLRPVVERLQREGVPGADVAWVQSAAAADVVMRVERDRVRFMPRTQAGATAEPGTQGLAQVRLARQPGDPAATDGALAALGAALHTIARATNLLRLADLAASRSDDDSPRLAVHVQLRRKGTQDTTEALPPESVPVVHHGDQLMLEVVNQGSRSLDLNVIYLDAAFGVKCWPRINSTVTRVPPGDSRRVPTVTIHADPTQSDAVGLERLIVVGTQATPLGEPTNLGFLAQPPLATEVARGGPADDDVQAFQDAAFGEASRTGRTPAPPGKGTVIQMRSFWVTQSAPKHKRPGTTSTDRQAR